MQKAVFIGADPQVAEIVRLGICLRWPDVTPLIATTGTGGIELVKEEKPDLVLLRPDFPDKSLTEVIRELRGFSDVPLVVLNHQSNDLEPVTALEAGADEYIQLPCELSELTFKVWSLMRRTEGRKSGKAAEQLTEDRKSTRLNSSHVVISYAVFCLKKKKKTTEKHTSDLQ